MHDGVKITAWSSRYMAAEKVLVYKDAPFEYCIVSGRPLTDDEKICALNEYLKLAAEKEGLGTTS